MFKKQITENVEYLDAQIGSILCELDKLEDGDKYEKVLGKLDKLLDIRCKLSENKNRESNAPMIVSGLIQVSSILLVLHYEKTDIVTSKVFNMATRLFKEGV